MSNYDKLNLNDDHDHDHDDDDDGDNVKIKTDTLQNEMEFKTNENNETIIELMNASSSEKNYDTITNKNKNPMQIRTKLWFLIFTGMAVNYMVIINISITLVAMIKSRDQFNNNIDNGQTTNVQQSWYACNINNTLLLLLPMNTNLIMSAESMNSNSTSKINDFVTTAAAPAVADDKLQINTTAFKKRPFTIEHTILKMFNIKFEENGFAWDETEQNLVLGSYFWLHWLTQIPGGILAQKYGTKLIFGGSNILSFLLCFLIPFATYLNIYALIGIRVIQGLIAGVSWPAMHHLLAAWVPPNERSKFVTAYMGTSAAMFILLPIFGFVIALTTWEWVFHLSGVFGILWYIAWQYNVYDTPAEHPNITVVERAYIEKSLDGSVHGKDERAPIPWRYILMSRPVWLIIIAQSAAIWEILTLTTQTPTYFKIIHGWSVQMTGIISGAPHFLRVLFAYSFSFMVDYLLRNGLMTRTNVRKLAAFTFCIVNGLFLMAMAHSNCNGTMAVTFLLLATTVHGAVSSGPLASMVDISPNYASILLGITSLIGVLPGFISPYIVGQLTLGNQTPGQWKYVFILTAIILMVPGTLFILFSDSSLQKWNDPRNCKKKIYSSPIDHGINEDEKVGLDDKKITNSFLGKTQITTK